MNPEELGQNHAMQNKTMGDDPKWTDIERDRYQAAYNHAKKKMAEQQKQD